MDLLYAADTCFCRLCMTISAASLRACSSCAAAVAVGLCLSTIRQMLPAAFPCAGSACSTLPDGAACPAGWLWLVQGVLHELRQLCRGQRRESNTKPGFYPAFGGMLSISKAVLTPLAISKLQGNKQAPPSTCLLISAQLITLACSWDGQQPALSIYAYNAPQHKALKSLQPCC